jgi:hypothetical protein
MANGFDWRSLHGVDLANGFDLRSPHAVDSSNGINLRSLHAVDLANGFDLRSLRAVGSANGFDLQFIHAVDMPNGFDWRSLHGSVCTIWLCVAIKNARLGLYLDKPSLETPSALFQMSTAGKQLFFMQKQKLDLLLPSFEC